MDAKAQQELADIKTELKNIIAELRTISYGVRTGFSGIGSEKCANVIDDVVDQYKIVQKTLDTMDTSAVAEEYTSQKGSSGGGHSGGGRSSGGGSSRSF